MFRTKSFAEIAAVFLYSRSSGTDKGKGQEKEQSSPGLFLLSIPPLWIEELNTVICPRFLRTMTIIIVGAHFCYLHPVFRCENNRGYLVS